jgi:hypothetical protein
VLDATLKLHHFHAREPHADFGHRISQNSVFHSAPPTEELNRSYTKLAGPKETSTAGWQVSPTIAFFSSGSSDDHIGDWSARQPGICC